MTKSKKFINPRQLRVYFDHNTKFEQTVIWESKIYEGQQGHGDVMKQLIDDKSIYAIAAALIENDVERLDADIAANLEAAYINENLDALMLIEQLKEWLFKDDGHYEPVNTGTYRDKDIELCFDLDWVYD